MNKQKAESQFVWTKYILLIGGLVVGISFIYLTYWSFMETKEWFEVLDFENDNGLVSLALAFVFQYGQGPVLYLRMKFNQRYRELQRMVDGYPKPPSPNDHGAYERYNELVHDAGTAWWTGFGFMFVFAIFAIVDAWTNVDQMHIGLDNKAASGVVVGQQYYILTTAVGSIMVFIEEGLGLVVSMTSNVFNDLRQIYGQKRIAWLDMFGQIAEEQLSGSSKNQWQPKQPQNQQRGQISFGSGRGPQPRQQAMPSYPQPRPQGQQQPLPTNYGPTFHQVRDPKEGDEFPYNIR